MCGGLLLLTKDGACCILSKAHAYNRWNTRKCHVATTTLQCVPVAMEKLELLEWALQWHAVIAAKWGWGSIPSQPLGHSD